MTEPTLINLYFNEYSQGIHYYPFAVNLDRCVRSCNTLNDLSNRICVPNKTEDLNLHVFSLVTGISEYKILTNHILCGCRCSFDGRKCKNLEKMLCLLKILCLESIYYWWFVVPTKAALIKAGLTNLNEKRLICKMKFFYGLLTFLLITIVLLIAVSIYCFLIRYQANQAHLLSYHVTNMKLEEVWF